MNISDLLHYANKQTVFVFDIDYTLYRNKGNFGSPEWIHHLVEQDIYFGFSRDEALLKNYSVWMQAQVYSEIELMEEELPSFLLKLTDFSAGFIGLTARGPVSSKITHNQLKLLDLHFNITEISRLPIFGECKNDILFENGILYVHEFNDKGRE